jgi:cysteine desulfurase
MHLDMAGIAASSGSACSSGDPKPSVVLQALGLGPEWTTGGLRFTAGLQNTAADIDAVLEHLPRITGALRRLSARLAPA